MWNVFFYCSVMTTYLESFVAYLKEVRGLSPATLASYSDKCCSFFEFLDDDGCDAIVSVTSDTISRYIAFRFRGGMQPSSINVSLNAIRQYFNWLLRFAPACCSMVNPCSAIQPVRVPSKTPRFIETSILRKIVDDMPCVSFKQLRSKLVVLLGWQCGLRRSEILNLRIEDVMLDAHVLRIFGKGRKERFVPIFDEVEQCLVAYMSSRTALLEIFSPHLICSSWGDALSGAQMRCIVRAALLPHVPVELAHPHVLRHSFATMLMQRGVPLQAISTVMGHASVVTTMRYLTINYDYVRQSIAAAFV